MVAMKRCGAVATAAAAAAANAQSNVSYINRVTKWIRTQKRSSSHTREPVPINYVIQHAVAAGTRPRTHVRVVALTP